ncbi:MAG: hypothetical protein AAB268_01815 [Elusimicrobiota bacterium]
MDRKVLLVGALMLTIGGGVLALAAGENSKENGKHAGTCPMRVSGAKVNVVKIDSGVVIHVTAGDAATVAEIQAAAIESGAGAVAHSGCKHCADSAASRPSEKSACAHGDACGDAKAAMYACSMGDYSGPRTKDERCPKCWMKLSLKK